MDRGDESNRTSRTHTKNLEYRITENKVKKTRKWSEQETAILLGCIQKYGHNAEQELQQHLPHKSLDSIKNYISTAKFKSKELPTHNILDKWLNACDSINAKKNVRKWDDSIQVAQVMKYLSVDGLIENHPLPENCDNIDFPAAYRLLYQALMGYPLQPVNKETADFITKTMGALICDVTNETQFKTTFEKVFTHLKGCFNNSDGCTKKNSVAKATSKKVPEKSPETLEAKKPVKTYQKKKPIQQAVENCEDPVLKLNIAPVSWEMATGVSSLQCFTVSLEGSSKSSLVAVPVTESESSAVNKRKKHLEKLYESSSYNPFQIPVDLLKL